jgi:hypothetical protein
VVFQPILTSSIVSRHERVKRNAVEMRQIAERDLRRLAHNPAVVSPRAIITIIADLDYGRTTLCEGIGIVALCNVIDE